MEQTVVLTVTEAARLAGMHPQTLRQYDRLGLVVPSRATGRGRRYSLRDVEKLREVQRLAQVEGVNLAGVRRILAMAEYVSVLETKLAEALAAQAEREQAGRRVFAAGSGGDVIVMRRGHRVGAGRADGERGYFSEEEYRSRAVIVWQPAQ